MRVITATKARQNLYRLIDDVNDNSEPMFIHNTKGQNAILVSEAEWRSIQETLYLESIPGFVDKVLEAAKEPEDECIVYNKDEEW